ncbi:IS3 family transposase [Candidatus Saccharibacteria bacterium]|nr:IS3 family transposase [Candidatus Saccharibacteria bacterium]
MYKHLLINQKLTIANIINQPPEEICKKYGISLATYYRIKRQFGTPKSLLRKFNLLKSAHCKLKAHAKKQAEIIEILQASDAKVSDPNKIRLAAADKLYPKYHANAIIAALDLSRGAFYNHLYRNKKDKSWFNVRRKRLEPIIKKIFEESDGIYGATKIAAIVSRDYEPASRVFVSSIMRELGLKGVDTRLSARKARHASKSLARLIKGFNVTAPNELWVTDFTELKLNKDRVFLCVYIDVFSRMVVGYAFSSTADTRLTIAALRDALNKRGNPQHLYIHSDQGTQYTSSEFQKTADELNLVRTFSRRGKPADNPIAESFFSCLKREEYRRHTYTSIPNLKRSIETYIDFYNNRRAHSAIKYYAPAVYEKLTKQKQKTN